eukprot:15158975-Alexandrium_andersonii.AAC.1
MHGCRMANQARQTRWAGQVRQARPAIVAYTALKQTPGRLRTFRQGKRCSSPRPCASCEWSQISWQRKS